jgi:hypothetical protein
MRMQGLWKQGEIIFGAPDAPKGEVQVPKEPLSEEVLRVPFDGDEVRS